MPVGFGQGPGLSNYDAGQACGDENVTLTTNQLPAHSHLVAASNSASDAGRPGNNFLAPGSYRTASDGTVMNPAMIGATGGSQPHPNLPPYLVLTPCIALEGIFPSRN
ncbi:MAG: phage tail protein [Acidimicrobiales bacterium]